MLTRYIGVIMYLTNEGRRTQYPNVNLNFVISIIYDYVVVCPALASLLISFLLLCIYHRSTVW